MYSVFYTSAVHRQLRRLPRDITAQVVAAVESLSRNPRTPHTEKLEGSTAAYRLRVGRYRLLYTIDDRIKRVAIYRIAHRREAYR